MTAQVRTTNMPRGRLALGAGGGAVVVLMTLAHTSNDALTSMLSATLPSIQSRLGLTEGTLALLVATLAISSSVTQPFFGALSDRHGARRVAALGTTLGVSLMSLITIIPEVPLLFAVLLVGGLGSAAFHPAGTSIASEAVDGRRELAVGLFSAGGTIGLALGPLLVLGAAATVGLGATPWLIVPAIALGVLMLVSVPDARRPAPASRAPAFDRGLLRGPVGTLAAIATLGSIAAVAFSAGYPLFLVAHRGVAPGDPVLGVTLAVFSLAAAGGAIVAALLASRVPRRLLVPSTLATAVVPLGTLLVIGPGDPLYLAVVAAAGALLNAGMPSLLVLAQAKAPGQRAVAAGMLMGLPVGLAGLAYVGIGWLQEVAGIPVALALAFAFTLPGALLAARILRAADATSEPTAAASMPLSMCGCVAGSP